MPRFSKHGNPPLHFPTWGDDETVTLFPVKPWGLSIEAQGVAERAVGAEALADLSSEERTEAIRAYLEGHEDAAITIQAYIVAGMIQSATFRDDDGTLIPVTPALVKQFSEEEIAFLMAEITRRNGAQEVPDTGGEFRPGAPTAVSSEELPPGRVGEPDGEAPDAGSTHREGDGLGLLPDTPAA